MRPKSFEWPEQECSSSISKWNTRSLALSRSTLQPHSMRYTWIQQFNNTQFDVVSSSNVLKLEESVRQWLFAIGFGFLPIGTFSAFAFRAHTHSDIPKKKRNIYINIQTVGWTHVPSFIHYLHLARMRLVWNSPQSDPSIFLMKFENFYVFFSFSLAKSSIHRKSSFAEQLELTHYLYAILKVDRYANELPTIWRLIIIIALYEFKSRVHKIGFWSDGFDQAASTNHLRRLRRRPSDL